MPLELKPEDRKQALPSLIRFCDQELDVEISEIQATALLGFFLKELAPSVYNGALADAEAFFRDRIADLTPSCSESEFGYWAKNTVRRK